jgi:hypothetical protein
LRLSEIQVIRYERTGAITCSFFFSINTGARVSEALSVRVRDVYRTVQLLDKGRKQSTLTPWGGLLSTYVLG